MTMAQKINMAVAYKGMSQAALARTISMTPSNFNQKLKRDVLTRGTKQNSRKHKQIQQKDGIQISYEY